VSNVSACAFACSAFDCRPQTHDPIIANGALYTSFPRALFAADQRLSISRTACFMLGRYLLAATSGVIDDEKKIRFRLPRTGPAPGMANAMALMPASDPPTDEA